MDVERDFGPAYKQTRGKNLSFSTFIDLGDSPLTDSHTHTRTRTRTRTHTHLHTRTRTRTHLHIHTRTLSPSLTLPQVGVTSMYQLTTAKRQEQTNKAIFKPSIKVRLHLSTSKTFFIHRTTKILLFIWERTTTVSYALKQLMLFLMPWREFLSVLI